MCPELGRSPHVQQGCMPLIGCCNVHGPGGSFFLVPTCARNSLLPRRPSLVGGGPLHTHASAQTEKTHICLLATLVPVVNPTWHTRSLHVTRTSMIALITAPICNYESTTAPVLEDDRRLIALSGGSLLHIEPPDGLNFTKREVQRCKVARSCKVC